MFCLFCQKNIKEVDFKNTRLLFGFISGLHKIKPRKKTGLCPFHQKQVAKAIKRARELSLLPYPHQRKKTP